MIRLVSVNIERSKHFDTVIPFIEQEKPDVLCIQEIDETEVSKIAEAYGSESYVFAPMLRHGNEKGNPVIGIAVFTHVAAQCEALYYYGSREQLPDHSETPDRGDTMNCAVAFAHFEKDGERYHIGTTHFTWSEKGMPTDRQRKNMRALLSLLENQDDFVLTGDFNAPRGGEIFSMLAEKYKDNIPPEYKTSIDLKLHRAGHLPQEKMDEKMVDGVFSTPDYTVSNVQLHDGISDHLAITADIRTR